MNTSINELKAMSTRSLELLNGSLFDMCVMHKWGDSSEPSVRELRKAVVNEINKRKSKEQP